MASQFISTELVRRVRKHPPARTTDYRDPKNPGFVLRARPSGVHSWRVQLPDRRWVALGRLDEVTLKDAREEAQRKRAAAALGHVVPASRRGGKGLILREFLDKTYEPWMKATFRGDAGQVTRIRWAFGELLDLELGALTAARVDRWRADRHNLQRPSKNKPQRPPRNVSRATVNRDVAALRAALGRAVEWGILPSNPLARLKQTAEDSSAVVRYLSVEEEQRLRDALTERDKARRAARESANAWREERGYPPWPAYGTYTDYLTPLVLLALNTGLRRGELLQLRWRDVRLDHAMLTVRGEGAKTGQTRHVPLNTQAVDVMTAWKPADAEANWLAFPGQTPTTPLAEARGAWEGLLKKASITSFRFHDLRHSFASKLVMAGVDLNTVRELLGHRKISMTLRYAHLAPQHKAAAVERLVAQG